MSFSFSAAFADTPQAIKSAVDLAGVCQDYGIELTEQGYDDNPRMVGLCPFHDDHDPSFAVFRTEAGHQMWGCWSCDPGPHDLFDFLQRWHDCGFGEALELARSLRGSGSYEPGPVVEREPLQQPNFRALLSPATQLDAVRELISAKGIPARPEWLQKEFRVASHMDTVFVPHIADGRVTGLKYRSQGGAWAWSAERGSCYPALYGAWRAIGQHEVVVCEGESDTWSVAYLLRDEPVDVFGLPSGVGRPPKTAWLELLQGRRVVLLFDGDTPGRDGAERWGKALSASEGTEAYVARLEDGKDATSLGPAAVLQALADSRLWRPAFTQISPTMAAFNGSGPRHG